MPFTHVEIEERKSRAIARLFIFLVLLYAVSLVTLVWFVKWLGLWPFPLAPFTMHVDISWREVIVAFAVSLGFGLLHWVVSTHRILERTLEAIGARPLDVGDSYHTRFSDIVAEVIVATGGRSITPYVIPTPAVNACAVSDFDGRAAIAVTEGALATLNRAQLESVIGHEAAHVVSGDNLTTSVFCALFALHEEAMRQAFGLFEGDGGGDRPGVVVRVSALLPAVYIVLAVTYGVKTLCSMLISREKEYRADAIAVRLTRNPLSLAEALHMISERWRGVSTRGESLSSIFIVDTGIEHLSEEEGLLAELFSTHPPTGNRIALLLGMAHLDPAKFNEEMTADRSRQHVRPLPQPTPIESSSPARWMLWNDEGWTGPFGLEAMTGRRDLLPDSWVRREDESAAQPASRDPELLRILRQRYAGSGSDGSGFECPRCHVGLAPTQYEGARIDECPACHGCYVDASNMVKIFSREEYDMSESVKRRGDFLLTFRGRALAKQQLQANRNRLVREWGCPRCGAAVIRKFFTETYPVEVDQCWGCGFAWLDSEELELLQYLYEKQFAGGNVGDGPRPADCPPAV